MPYLQKRGKNWYIRVQIPKELLVQFAPQKEIKRSLKTCNLTQARKLSHSLLYEIHQSFFQMRYSTPMQIKPPSLQAHEIFNKLYPGQDALVSKPYSLNWNKNDLLVFNSNLVRIQQYLDAGYEANAEGKFDTRTPPKNEPVLYQQAQSTDNQLTATSISVTSTLNSAQSKSVKIVIDEYIKQDSHVSESTLKCKGYALKHLADFAKNKTCHEVLTEECLDIFLNSFLIDNCNLEIGTRKGQFKILKTFLGYCKKKKYIDGSTFDDIKEIRLVATQSDKAQQEDIANESYLHSELQLLLDSFIDKPAVNNNTFPKRLTHIRTIYYVLVAMFTGFRSQTLRQLKDSNFDFSAKVHTITVKNELVEINGRKLNTNKTAQSLGLPIVKQLTKLHIQKFVELKAHTNNIFHVTATLDQRLDAQLISSGLKKDKQRIHAIRGTVNNQYLIAEVPTDLKEQLMGHIVQKSSASYDDLRYLMKECPENVQSIMERTFSSYKIDFSRLETYLKTELDMLN